MKHLKYFFTGLTIVLIALIISYFILIILPTIISSFFNVSYDFVMTCLIFTPIIFWISYTIGKFIFDPRYPVMKYGMRH